MQNYVTKMMRINTLIGVIKEMGVIEPSDLTARLYTTENRMATGEVKRKHH